MLRIYIDLIISSEQTPPHQITTNPRNPELNPSENLGETLEFIWNDPGIPLNPFYTHHIFVVALH